MTRIILLVALVAVGCDAYFAQGFYTRATVQQIEIGVQKLSAMSSQQAAPQPVPPAAVPELPSAVPPSGGAPSAEQAPLPPR